MPWICSRVSYPVIMHFAAFQIFCSIRQQHRPIGIQISITKNLLIVGWHIQPLKNKVRLFQICSYISDLWERNAPAWHSVLEGNQFSPPTPQAVPMAGDVPFLFGFKVVSEGCRQDTIWQGRLGCAHFLRCICTCTAFALLLPSPPGEPGRLSPSTRTQQAAPLPLSSTCIVCAFPVRIKDAPECHPWPQPMEDNKTRRRHLALAHWGRTCQCYPVRRLHPNHNKVHCFHGLWLSSALKPFLFQDNLIPDPFCLSRSQWETSKDFSSRCVLAKLITNGVNWKTTDVTYLSKHKK